MDDPLYREIILDHWKNPHNAGVIEGANIDVREFNPLCGDDIRLTIKLSTPRHPEFISGSPDNVMLKQVQHDKTSRIENIKFSGQGCAISQASASILTDEVQGKSLEEIKLITPENHLAELGIELTPARLKCALLSLTTLKKGIGS